MSAIRNARMVEVVRLELVRLVGSIPMACLRSKADHATGLER
jgi:hypothetical protein